MQIIRANNQSMGHVVRLGDPIAFGAKPHISQPVLPVPAVELMAAPVPAPKRNGKRKGVAK